jgi:hypothetical protein
MESEAKGTRRRAQGNCKTGESSRKEERVGKSNRGKEVNQKLLKALPVSTI